MVSRQMNDKRYLYINESHIFGSPGVGGMGLYPFQLWLTTCTTQEKRGEHEYDKQ